MIENFISLFQTSFYQQLGHYVSATWPIWFPLLTVRLFLYTWFNYKRRLWVRKQGYVIIEVKLPRDVLKTPLAMELVLNGIWEDVNGSITDVFIDGRVRDWFSLEIASIGGQVKFFIWMLPKWRNIVESRFYAQYPGVEIFEAKDHLLDIIYNPVKMSLFGVNTALVKADAYPIKTYVDYGLDKDGLEAEEVIDPMQLLIEYMGSIKPTEQIWIQLLIQAHRKETLADDATLVFKPDWLKGVKDEIKKIVEEEALVKPAEGKPATLQHLTKTQDETINAIQRNSGKLAFNSMMRILYTAPVESFDKMKGAGLIGSMRHFASKNLNGIKPKFFSTTYPWEDFGGKDKIHNQKSFLEAIKRRSYFSVPFRFWKAKPYVLTTEEVATVFHLPGAVVTTPTLSRVPSKKSEAPANLPV